MLEELHGYITEKRYLNIHQILLSLLRKLNLYFTGYVIFFSLKCLLILLIKNYKHHQKFYLYIFLVNLIK
jgi:hypothetical protein